MANSLPGQYFHEYGPSFRLISEVISCDQTTIRCICSLNYEPLGFLADHLSQGVVVPGAILIEACGQSAFLFNAINNADTGEEGSHLYGVLAKVESAVFSSAVMRSDSIVIETKRTGFRAGFAQYNSKVIVAGKKAAKVNFFSKRVRG